MPKPIPLRGLAELGILKDPRPYDLPPNAWTGGSNVRFSTGKARRAPIFRRYASRGGLVPQHIVGYRPSTGFDEVYFGGEDGRIWRCRERIFDEVTPTSRILSNASESWTSTFLGDVLYLNRPSHVPAALLPGASRFVDLSGWDASWRARSLRAFRDVLFAINLTKGPTALPTSVHWSDIALAGQMPRSWDVTDLSTVSNEVLIPQLDSPLVDGLPLKGTMVLYSETQVHLVEYTGDTSDAGQNLFVNRPLFNEGGLIAPNAVCEVDGKHFVFGVNDIYVHDGIRKESIADGRVREWVFRNLVSRYGERCFVQHMPNYNEVMFGFVAQDEEHFFKGPTRCNRCAVYNYGNGTWSLGDLPNVCGATIANADPSLVWSNATTPWELMGGSWSDLADGYEGHILFGCEALSGGPPVDGILAYDSMDEGQLPYPFEAESNAPAFLERVGLDLDEIGADLGQYKVLKRVYPQVRVHRQVPIQVQIGSSLTSGSSIKWQPKVSFDPETQYKVDAKAGGRYLSMRFFVDRPADFEVSGFDADIVSGGSR